VIKRINCSTTLFFVWNVLHCFTFKLELFTFLRNLCHNFTFRSLFSFGLRMDFC